MLEVHVNFPDPEEAASVSRAAVERRLAACANIGGPIRSIYWWNGAVQDEGETAVVFKTSEERADALMAFVAERHSYEVPGIVLHRPLGANDAYAEWVVRETGNPA